MSSDDPFAMDAWQMRWRMRYELGLSISDPRSMIAFSDEDTDKLPGQLPRLARAIRDAPAGAAARAAADAFLTVSEEYVSAPPPKVPPGPAADEPHPPSAAGPPSDPEDGDADRS